MPERIGLATPDVNESASPGEHWLALCLKWRSPRLVTEGPQVTYPNTHVTAFSRSITSNPATQNASAVPVTIRTNTILNSRRDVTKMDGNSQPSEDKKNPCKPGSVGRFLEGLERPSCSSG